MKYGYTAYMNVRYNKSKKNRINTHWSANIQRSRYMPSLPGPSLNDQPSVPHPYIPALVHERTVYRRLQYAHAPYRVGTAASNEAKRRCYGMAISKVIHT
jgi:hypothetical protein